MDPFACYISSYLLLMYFVIIYLKIYMHHTRGEYFDHNTTDAAHDIKYTSNYDFILAYITK